MRTIVNVYFDDGDSLVTPIYATPSEAIEYYQDKVFTYYDPNTRTEKKHKVTNVEILNETQE